LKNLCPTGCPVGQYQFIFSNIKNPPSIKPITGNFQVDTQDNTTAVVNRGIVANNKLQAISPNPMEVTIQRSSLALGASSSISVFIKTTDPFPLLNGGAVQINIPKV
jgi:hypothetical protein